MYEKVRASLQNPDQLKKNLSITLLIFCKEKLPRHNDKAQTFHYKYFKQNRQ
jgi:hypothetical protein